MRAGRSLTIEVKAYLRDRRHLGFSLVGEGSQLLAFARFAEVQGYDGHLTEELAKAWAQDGQPSRLTSADSIQCAGFLNIGCSLIRVPKSPRRVSLDPRPVASPRTSMKRAKLKPCLALPHSCHARRVYAGQPT